MAFRLTRSETVNTAIQRVMRDELTSAASALARAQKDARNSRVRDEGIHDARKSMKKLRGLLRMLEPRLGDMASRENLALRTAAHSLSGARDAAAVRETVELLSTRFPGGRGLATLRRKLKAGPKGIHGPDTSTAAVVLAEVAGHVAEWPPLPDNFNSVAEGLRKTYRRGRKALERATEEPTPTNFHDLRKRVKDHWYQVRLLEHVWDDGAPREKELRHLQECLGQEHDLYILETTVPLSASVSQLVEVARHEFRAEALKLAHKLYERRPGQHIRHLQGLWDKWQRTQRLVRKEPTRAELRRRLKVTSAA